MWVQLLWVFSVLVQSFPSVIFLNRVEMGNIPNLIFVKNLKIFSPTVSEKYYCLCLATDSDCVECDRVVLALSSLVTNQQMIDWRCRESGNILESLEEIRATSELVIDDNKGGGDLYFKCDRCDWKPPTMLNISSVVTHLCDISIYF